jgi:CBS domain-containing protein
MNILFFLKPKATLEYVEENYTLRQTMEKMEVHRYTSIPIITKKGEYLGTLSEGDILWHFKQLGEFDLQRSEQVKITDIKRHKDNAPIKINANIQDLLNVSKSQNFVPVIDDRNMFIGIVTRQDIITYFYDVTMKEHIEN